MSVGNSWVTFPGRLPLRFCIIHLFRRYVKWSSQEDRRGPGAPERGQLHTGHWSQKAEWALTSLRSIGMKHVETKNKAALTRVLVWGDSLKILVWSIERSNTRKLFVKQSWREEWSSHYTLNKLEEYISVNTILYNIYCYFTQNQS